MAKHTPGPWYVDPREPLATDDATIRIWDTNWTGPTWGINMVAKVLFLGQGASETQLANARLIAAAPDLLEACEGMDSAINNIRHELGTQYPALSEAWVNLGAAIAKATGE